jgi:glutathione S-transferase
MNLRDLWDSVRGRRPRGAGDGVCRTADGRTIDLEIYKFDSCPYRQHVIRAVERLGVPVRYRDILEDDAAARKLVEIGGLDQVPCLLVDGRPLYDSADIVAFLEREFGPGGEAPETR